ncbi:CLUMA_CG006857, isoform A [Clunio marinus]|uniref:CLUMA_CG006857, isoform A n=1 Tax=Clunio marinus TaxID=568069 RepID=A0A1J1I153_9DIPT|nr:CLUMA_CG006857, isoform A [Clunio marinus]
MNPSLGRKLENLHFREANSPIYFVSKALGQLPFCIEFGKRNRTVLKFTILSVAFSMFCYSLYCASMYFFAVKTYENAGSFPTISLIES